MMSNRKNNVNFEIRFATIKDVDLILKFIKDLAIYEKMLDQVVVTKDHLIISLFEKKEAEVLIGEENGKPVGFALFFQSYSTFLGRSNIFLEDLFIDEAHRHKGYGTLLLAKLADLAIKRNCKRLEWVCLNWNKPSIDFYLKIGATPMDEWTIYRMQGEHLKNLAKRLPNESNVK
jgi:GNAT superfamily N-acetyltransferase